MIRWLKGVTEGLFGSPNRESPNEEEERIVHQYEARATFANGRTQFYEFNSFEQYSDSIVLYRLYDDDTDAAAADAKVEGIISMHNLNDFYISDRDETPLRELVYKWVDDATEESTAE